jgi:hypothetical protein
MIHLHKFLHPFLGKKISYKTIFFLVLWTSLAHVLSIFVDPNFYLSHPVKVIVFSLLLTDVVAGAYINTKDEVISYYDQHAHLILRFAPFHIFILISAWLFNVSFILVLAIYLAVVISTTRTLTLVKHKRLIAYTLFVLGAFIFGYFESGSSLSFVLLIFVFVYKLLISFGTRHYASCPVSFKK